MLLFWCTLYIVMPSHMIDMHVVCKLQKLALIIIITTLNTENYNDNNNEYHNYLDKN